METPPYVGTVQGGAPPVISWFINPINYRYNDLPPNSAGRSSFLQALIRLATAHAKLKLRPGSEEIPWELPGEERCG